MPGSQRVQTQPPAQELLAQDETYESLQKKFALYRNIFDQAPAAILFCDADAVIRYANRASARLFGISHKHLVGMHLLLHIKHSSFKNAIRRALENKKAQFSEIFTDASHQEHFYTAKFNTLYTPDGSVEGVIALITQIPLQSPLQKQSLLATIQAERYFEAAGVMILALDQKANIVRINQKGCEITGYTQKELIGKNWIDLCIPAHLRTQIHAVFAQVITKDVPIVEHYTNEILTKSGQLRTISWHNSLICDFEGNVIEVLSTGEDITELIASQQALTEHKLYDQLTALPNRLMLFDRLEHALLLAQKEHTQLALIYIDIDNFNVINDTYGHHRGDQILREFVRRIQSLVEPSDTIARFGGDEFIIIKEQINSPSAASILAEEVLRMMQKAFVFDDSFHYLGASIGISLFPQNATKAQALVQMAETAMNRAKKEGKNQYSFYTKALSDALYQQMEIENNLRHALENDEFRLFFQPQYSLAEQKIIGAEVLLRWHNPALGNVSPMQFIPIAERNRLIIPLGRRVLTQACIMAARWHKAGIFDGRIAVNVSGVQMEYDDLILSIEKALKTSGLHPGMLEIEVTESVLMQSPQKWINLLERIKEKGIHIAIDDFGTGYSSLSYLRHFPLDTLKIDKSFVDDLPTNNDACMIAKAIIALAKSLGLKTVAEGIENEAQLHYLQQIGCDYAQGFHFCKPLDAQKTEQLLQQKSR